MPRRHRKMRKGGFLGFGESSSNSNEYNSSNSGSGSGIFGSVGSTLSGWGTSISDTASSAWNKTKNATSGAYNSATGTTPSTTYPSTTSTFGGKRKRSRKMHGGFSDNTPTTGLAYYAAPISGIKSAQPHNWVGGKTKKRCGGKTKKRRGGKHRHSKSCKR
jgi:hypothetical protein